VALAASQISNLKRAPIGGGLWMVTGTFTGPASYTSGGEDLTNALAKSCFGIQRVNHLSFTDLVDENNTALAVTALFDHNRTTTSQGKIRFVAAGVTAHTHDISIIGGQAAAATDTVFCPAATDLLGKQEAANALVLGADVATKGGVVAAAAVAAGAEVASTTDLSGYICRFVAYGC
jgi:hypothetical protein